MYEHTVISALMTLREYALGYDTSSMGLPEAINILDNAGVFHEVDEQTGYDMNGVKN